MAISNCLFSPTSENPRGFSVWCVLAKLSAETRNYSLPYSKIKNKPYFKNLQQLYLQKAYLFLLLQNCVPGFCF